MQSAMLWQPSESDSGKHAKRTTCGKIGFGGKVSEKDKPFRYPSFSLGHTVGEMQGELQHPPESLRVGRRCVLLDGPLSNEDVPDPVAGKFVHYLD